MPPEAQEIARAAKRCLFQAGYELPGRRLELFAVRLLTLAEAEPDGTPADQLAAAVDGIEGGPVTLVAEEPELGVLALTFPARSVTEAAELALHVVGQQLLSAYRRRGVGGTREGLLEHLDQQAHALAEMTGAAKQSDDMSRLLAVRDQVFVIRETLAALGVPHSLLANDTWTRHVGRGGA